MCKATIMVKSLNVLELHVHSHLWKLLDFVVCCSNRSRKWNILQIVGLFSLEFSTKGENCIVCFFFHFGLEIWDELLMWIKFLSNMYPKRVIKHYIITLSSSSFWRSLMFSVLACRLSSLGLSPGWGHCVVFWSKLLYSQNNYLFPPRCVNGYQQILMLRVTF